MRADNFEMKSTIGRGHFGEVRIPTVALEKAE